MAGTDAAKTQVKGANGAVATIERATSDDVPAIKAMVQSAYTKYIERIGKEPAPMTADYSKLLNTHDIFVLRPEGSPTAQGSIVLLARPDSDAVDINNLVVDVASQGKGYGRLLMNYAEDFARAKGRVALELYTNVKMWENIGLYAKMGFDEVDRRVEDGYERVYFRKPLN
ncbi:unnamed protein product [Clonostachys byssicola]|uniref:N-acetyltransferase domain-containing protein n=1 Tax=Clonostachys byssicola TaxID=160290 RepID=A0A9N9U7N4_9HYPO|nr:unnamed protein product [Clonostachys byssicola]